MIGTNEKKKMIKDEHKEAADDIMITSRMIMTMFMCDRRAIVSPVGLLEGFFCKTFCLMVEFLKVLNGLCSMSYKKREKKKTETGQSHYAFQPIE